VTGLAGADGVVRNIGIPRRVGLGLDELAAQAVAQHRPEKGETGPADSDTAASGRIRAALGIFGLAREALDLEIETRVSALERALRRS
jgi:hypothetical protein